MIEKLLTMLKICFCRGCNDEISPSIAVAKQEDHYIDDDDALDKRRENSYELQHNMTLEIDDIDNNPSGTGSWR